MTTSPASGGGTNLTVISCTTACPLGGSTSHPSSLAGAQQQEGDGDDNAQLPAHKDNMVLVNNFTHCDDGPFVSHFNNCQV